MYYEYVQQKSKNANIKTCHKTVGLRPCQIKNFKLIIQVILSAELKTSLHRTHTVCIKFQANANTMQNYRENAILQIIYFMLCCSNLLTCQCTVQVQMNKQNCILLPNKSSIEEQ